ncbi:MAG: flagellar export chaperone FliS [Acidobacteria bacterium]|nr:flagellar export chaperone FliS [Acidobacteriota bacterium]
MVNDIRNAYLESRVLAADPVQLVRMLYDGALKSIAEARRQLNCGNIRARSQAITKTAEILSELVSSLDAERGGEIAVRLRQLYDYMLQRLVDANRDQMEAPLIEVASLLATLNEAWAEIAPGSAPAPAPAPVSYAVAAAEVSADYVPRSWSA